MAKRDDLAWAKVVGSLAKWIGPKSGEVVFTLLEKENSASNRLRLVRMCAPLLGSAIPIVAIQVNVVEADGKKVLHFSKILDTYEEPEEEGSTDFSEYHTEEHWDQKSPWTLEAAKALFEATKSKLPNSKLHFVKNYIAIEVNGNNYIWLHKRGNGKSLLNCWISETNMQEAIALLDKAGFVYSRKNQTLRITTDSNEIIAKADVLGKIADLAIKS